MVDENIDQEFRLKNINETRKYFLKEIEQNEIVLNTSYFSFYNYWIYFNFCFCFFTWYSYRNYEFCNRIKICAIIAGIESYG